MPTGYLTRIVEFTGRTLSRHTGVFRATSDHSHRYRCAVTVKVCSIPRAAVMSLPSSDPAPTRSVARFDGRHINEDIAPFAGGAWSRPARRSRCTCGRKSPGVAGGRRLGIASIEESPNHYSEYRGEP